MNTFRLHCTESSEVVRMIQRLIKTSGLFVYFFCKYINKRSVSFMTKSFLGFYWSTFQNLHFLTFTRVKELNQYFYSSTLASSAGVSQVHWGEKRQTFCVRAAVRRLHAPAVWLDRCKKKGGGSELGEVPLKGAICDHLCCSFSSTLWRNTERR